MGALYDTDFMLWSEQQADLLRRLAHGEKVNDVDWPNLIEEVDGLGRSELNTVRSLVQGALEHLLKCAAWPQSTSVRGWRQEVRAFLDKADYHWSPGMAQRIELDAIYRKALRRVRELESDDGPPLQLTSDCPVTLEDLLVGDVADLAPRFRRTA